MQGSFLLWLRIIWTAFVIVIITVIIAPPMILVSLFNKSGICAYRMMHLWTYLLSRSMGLTFSISGADKIVPGTSYIITPNHQGYADVLALVGMLPLRFRWVVKLELLKIPFFGWALSSTGAISLNRSDKRQAVKSLRDGMIRLPGGWSVLIYPEGTRTSDGNLQSFKKGAFMIAVQSGIPILPVTSNGAFKILPRKTIAFRPGHITLTVADPIATEGLTEMDVPELMEKTRTAISENLDPNYDPFS
ncbi:MAG: lysophospholipid acyltransferase family protein [Desulfomonilaceae bacterium]